ncbi:hypothetical protein OV203_01580 [Nannocystis sp. ILAH1]|uniref:hypothetical protein n=1 Tax=Nannocystis sp. ILAH1 TaxID=2996789 RepID=UPI00226E1920|nr:hypothetical protein [Nannocystis sp. ILAH1]MCY0985802.1 hypothetical protein [Nannocystis sp. ILAH1]
MNDLNTIVQNLRRAGFGQYVDAAAESVDSICQIAGFQKVPVASLPAQSVPSQTLVVMPGAAPAPQLPPQPQVPETPPFPECSELMTLIKSQYIANCGFCPNPCLLRWIELAVLLKSYAEVRDDFGIPDLNLVPTLLTPTGTTANGLPTTFVSNFNVAPGQSILLRTQDYSLPFNPRCLWGALAFNGGNDSENYKHVNFKIWVGPSNASGAFSMQGGPLREWAPRRFIYGSQFRCGDSCTEVPLRSYTGCTDVDVVGLDSSIFIQVDNLATASNAISGQQLVIRLGGFEKPCCDSCAAGKACGCKKH